MLIAQQIMLIANWIIIIAKLIIIIANLISRPLKSTHLRDIARKQCPADFFNK